MEGGRRAKEDMEQRLLESRRIGGERPGRVHRRVAAGDWTLAGAICGDGEQQPQTGPCPPRGRNPPTLIGSIDGGCCLGARVEVDTPRPSRGSLSASSGRADQPHTGGMEFATAKETWRRACVWCNRQDVANRCSSCGAGIKSTCLKILTTNGILQRRECTDHIKHSEGWKYTDLEGATRSLWVGVRYSVLDQDSGSSSTQSVHVSNRDTRPTATCLGLARGGSLWSGGARIGAACGSCHSRPVRGPLTRTLRVKGPARRAARSLCITARAGAARSRRLSVHTDSDSGAARRVHTNGGHHSLPRL